MANVGCSFGIAEKNTAQNTLSTKMVMIYVDMLTLLLPELSK